MVAPRYLINSYDIGYLVLWITALLVHASEDFDKNCVKILNCDCLITHQCSFFCRADQEILHRKN